MCFSSSDFLFIILPAVVFAPVRSFIPQHLQHPPQQFWGALQRRALIQPPPSADAFMPEYYCGIDPLTKMASVLFSGLCPKDKCEWQKPNLNFYRWKSDCKLLVNWCCFQHDNCYDALRWPSLLPICDRQVGGNIFNTMLIHSILIIGGRTIAITSNNWIPNWIPIQ